MKKLISICIPCYNEEKNINLLYQEIIKEIGLLIEYDWEIIFADNASTDRTRIVLRQLAAEDKRVKVIFNVRNFGPARSAKNALFRAKGDAVISLVCDLQEPPSLIPQFAEKWEEGAMVVWGQKKSTKGNKIKYALQSLYYKIIEKCSPIKQYKQVTGFGLYDRQVVQAMLNLEEPQMSARHMIAELGYKVRFISYEQRKRVNGKSSFNIVRYFDFALMSLLHTSKLPLRIATLIGIITAFLSFVMGVIYLIYKLTHWYSFQAGMAPILISIFFLGSVQLMFIGIVGEYVGTILDKVTKRPLVVEEETINF